MSINTTSPTSLTPSTSSGGDWPRTDQSMPVPNTSLLPGSEKAPTAAVELMGRVVQGAHDTIDRLADSAAPAVRQFGEGLAGAEETLHAKTAQMRDARDAWSESLRQTVRTNPLASLAAALVVGALIARITR